MSSVFRWWMIFCSIAAGCVFVQLNGLFVAMFQHDLSKLSTIALTVFTIVSLFIGYITHTIHNKHNYEHLKYIPSCWFASELLMGLGMLGTLIGFMLMFSTKLASIDTTDTANIQGVILQLGQGLTTAVTATLVGLATSLLTKLQLISLEQNLDEDSFSDDDQYEEA